MATLLDYETKAGVERRGVICLKQISVEGNGHCCHRPSSNWETNQRCNERADALAKQSLNMPDINSTNYLELPEVFSLIKSHVISEWQRNYDNNSKGQHYKCIC